MEDKNNSSSSKEKNNKGLIAVLVVLVVVIIGLVSYILVDRDVVLATKNNENADNKKVIEKGENTTKEKTSSDTIIDINKCINCTDKNGYYLINSKSHMDEVQAYFYSNNNTKGIMTIDVSAYNQKTGNAFNVSNNNYEYNFNQPIKDAGIYSIGQDDSTPIVMYLMKDGTINYVDIYKGLTANNLSEYKKVANVEDISTMYAASMCSGDYCSVKTVLAQKDDGTFYDLGTLING